MYQPDFRRIELRFGDARDSGGEPRPEERNWGLCDRERIGNLRTEAIVEKGRKGCWRGPWDQTLALQGRHFGWTTCCLVGKGAVLQKFRGDQRCDDAPRRGRLLFGQLARRSHPQTILRRRALASSGCWWLLLSRCRARELVDLRHSVVTAVTLIQQTSMGVNHDRVARSKIYRPRPFVLRSNVPYEYLLLAYRAAVHSIVQLYFQAKTHAPSFLKQLHKPVL